MKLDNIYQEEKPMLRPAAAAADTAPVGYLADVRRMGDIFLILRLYPADFHQQQIGRTDYGVCLQNLSEYF